MRPSRARAARASASATGTKGSSSPDRDEHRHVERLDDLRRVGRGRESPRSRGRDPPESRSSASRCAFSTTAGSASSGKSFGRMSSQSAAGPPSRISSIVAARPARRSGVSGSAREPDRTSARTRSRCQPRHRERRIAAHGCADDREVAVDAIEHGARPLLHRGAEVVELGSDHVVARERLELRLPHPRVERVGVQEDDVHSGQHHTQAAQEVVGAEVLEGREAPAEGADIGHVPVERRNGLPQSEVAGRPRASGAPGGGRGTSPRSTRRSREERSAGGGSRRPEARQDHPGRGRPARRRGCSPPCGSRSRANAAPPARRQRRPIDEGTSTHSRRACRSARRSGCARRRRRTTTPAGR